MAITIVNVTRDRDFETPKVASDQLTCKARYFVQFATDTTDEYADYARKAAMCLTAQHPTDPIDASNKVPAYGSELTSLDGTIYYGTYVRNITPKIHKKQNNYWQVDVDYRPPDTNESGETDVLDDDPENIEVTYDWDTTNVKVKLWQDFTEVAKGGPLAIVNSANDPFTTLPQVDKDLLTCTIRRKTQGSYDPLVAAGLVNKINDANLTINGKGPFPIRTAKLRRWAAREREAVVQKQGLPQTAVVYDDETIVIVIDLDTWLGRVFDQGLQAWYDTGANGFDPNTKQPIVRNGQKVRSPQALNGRGKAAYGPDGAKLNNINPVALPGDDNGKPGVEVIGADLGALLLFNFYELGDFSILGSI